MIVYKNISEWEGEHIWHIGWHWKTVFVQKGLGLSIDPSPPWGLFPVSDCWFFFKLDKTLKGAAVERRRNGHATWRGALNWINWSLTGRITQKTWRHHDYHKESRVLQGSAVPLAGSQQSLELLLYIVAMLWIIGPKAKTASDGPEMQQSPLGQDSEDREQLR